LHHPTAAEHHLAFTLAQRQPLCVLCLELDGIKALTWARDPTTGEDLLTTLTARLAQALGDAGTLAALDGATFAFLLPGIPDRERLCLVAWKLLDAAAAPVTLGNIRFALSPWVGIARSPADGTSPGGLFRNACSAMHRARHQKSGYAFFDESADVWEHDD
jgi:GGDEF domain-containing protein